MAYGKREDWWASDQVMDTLRLSIDDYTAIVAELTRNQRNARRVECREHERLQFWRKRCVLQLKHADMQRPPYRVFPNNVSVGGASVLHGFFVTAGTPCELALQGHDGTMVTAAGTVVRCRHVLAKVHELGIAFSRRLDLGELFPDRASKSGGAAGDEAGAGRFHGHVLQIDDCEEDRELFSFVASELGVEAHVAATLADARAVLAGHEVDLVLVKLGLPDGGAAGVAEELRKGGHRGAIHAVSCGTSPISAAESRLQAEALARGCNGIVYAPLTQDRLVDVFTGIVQREYGGRDGVEPIYSRHWSNAKMRPLITKFVAILESRVHQLENLLAQEQIEGLRRECQQLAASSSSYGFDEIARRLGEVDALVANGRSVEVLRGRLAELVRLSAATRVPKR